VLAGRLLRQGQRQLDGGARYHEGEDRLERFGWRGVLVHVGGRSVDEHCCDEGCHSPQMCALADYRRLLFIYRTLLCCAILRVSSGALLFAGMWVVNKPILSVAGSWFSLFGRDREIQKREGAGMELGKQCCPVFAVVRVDCSWWIIPTRIYKVENINIRQAQPGNR
jgi:hypothetical protein